MHRDSDISLPPQLAEKFLESCRTLKLGEGEVLRALVEEFLAEIEAAEIAKSRRDKPEGFVSLEDMTAKYGLDG